MSALGKTKRKNPQNFQFEYPFITAGICLVCWSDSPDKERGKKCTGSSSYLSPPVLLLVGFTAVSAADTDDVTNDATLINEDDISSVSRNKYIFLE